MFLAACQPQVQPESPDIQSPDLTKTEFLTGDGKALPVKAWLPEGPIKAVILALHGFNDYSNAFTLGGDYLSKHGIAVYAYDQRGFGGTMPRGIWPGLFNMRQDAREMLNVLAEKHPSVPRYLMGESMGGAVAISTCAHYGCGDIEGLVLVAPAVWGDSSLNVFYRFPLWLAAHTIPASTWTGEDLEIQATDNIELLIAMGKDPMILFESRTDAIYGIVNLMDEVYQDLPKIERPILYLYGAKDEVIPSAATAQAITQIKSPYSVAYYPEGYHMLLRDLQRQKVLDDIISWINDRYHPLPSGRDMGWKEELGVFE